MIKINKSTEVELIHFNSCYIYVTEMAKKNSYTGRTTIHYHLQRSPKSAPSLGKITASAAGTKSGIDFHWTLTYPRVLCHQL